MKSLLFVALLLATVAAENFMIEVRPLTSEKLDRSYLATLTRPQRRQAVYNFLTKQAETSQRDLLQALSGLKTRSFWISNRIYVEDLPIEMIEVLASRSDVLTVRREGIAHAIGQEEYSAGVSDSRSDWNLELVRAPEAWQITRGEGITVGVIDTGARYSHESLIGSYRGNNNGSLTHDYNFFDPRGNAVEPEDNNGHGTHCAGSIAGSEESGIGVAPGAKWIASKGCATILCLESDLLASAEFVLCPTKMDGSDPDCSVGADVVSNSWGGNTGDNWYRSSVEAWRDAGMIPVFAQGNSGPSCGSVNSPGDMDIVIGVGAVDSGSTLALFSSRGPGLGIEGFPEIKPDISAPGVQIRSASNRDDTSYTNLSGTSMACPHISGVVALMLSANPNMSYDQVYSILTETANQRFTEPTGQSSCGGVSYTQIPNNHYGYGIADAYTAVMQARSMN